MREADRWLGFANEDLRVAELALNKVYTIKFVFILNSV